MPSGGTPPNQVLPQSVFDALHAMTYSSQAKAFVSQNTNYYMFVEQDQNGAGRWFYGTNTEGGSNPRGDVPQLTGDAIINGTFDSQTGLVTYNNTNYKFRHERDSNGNHIANAIVA